MFSSRAARRFLSLLTIMIGSGATIRAQTDGADYERILLPVVLFPPVAGAADSLWTTDFWIRNGAGQPVGVSPYDWLLCSINVCVPEVPPPPPTPSGISCGGPDLWDRTPASARRFIPRPEPMSFWEKRSFT